MGDTNRFSHTKILPWHQLRLQPEPKKHAFNFNPACSWVREYATNWNTIQPCLPSSKPWYSPEKINHSIPAPKTHKKRFRLGGNPGKKTCRPLSTRKTSSVPWGDSAPRFSAISLNFETCSFIREMRGLTCWNLKFWRSMLWRSRISANWNQSKKMFPHLCHLIISSHHAVMQSSEVLATITTFPDTTAGSWKHKDFPLPVAMYTQVSWLCMHVRVTWESSAYVYETYNILENLTANVFEKTFRWQSRTWFKMLRCSILFQHLNYQ